MSYGVDVADAEDGSGRSARPRFHRSDVGIRYRYSCVPYRSTLASCQGFDTAMPTNIPQTHRQSVDLPPNLSGFISYTVTYHDISECAWSLWCSSEKLNMIPHSPSSPLARICLEQIKIGHATRTLGLATNGAVASLISWVSASSIGGRLCG